jgi:hypothetical protein
MIDMKTSAPNMTVSDWLRIAEMRLNAVRNYHPESAEIQRLTFVVNDLRSKL